MMANEPASWQNPRILFTLLIVFLCGATAGMVAMALGAHQWMHERAAASSVQPTTTWKDPSKAASLERFQRELDLTPQQTQQLETILDDFFTYYHTLQSQLDDVRASGKQRILRILNENQKKKFEKLMTELQEKRLK